MGTTPEPFGFDPWRLAAQSRLLLARNLRTSMAKPILQLETMAFGTLGGNSVFVLWRIASPDLTSQL